MGSAFHCDSIPVFGEEHSSRKFIFVIKRVLVILNIDIRSEIIIVIFLHSARPQESKRLCLLRKKIRVLFSAIQLKAIYISNCSIVSCPTCSRANSRYRLPGVLVLPFSRRSLRTVTRFHFLSSFKRYDTIKIVNNKQKFLSLSVEILDKEQCRAF